MYPIKTLQTDILNRVHQLALTQFYKLPGLFLIIFCFCSPLHAQDKDEPFIISVLDFELSGISTNEMRIFTDYISSHIVSTGKYTLIDRRHRISILEEIEFSYQDCIDEACQLEIGKLLSANFIVVGSLGKIGDRYILNMRLIEIETGKAITTSSKVYGSMNALVDDSMMMTFELLGEEVPEVLKTEIAKETETEKKLEAPKVTEVVKIEDEKKTTPITYIKNYYTFNHIQYKRSGFWASFEKLVDVIDNTPGISANAKHEINNYRTFVKSGKIMYFSGLSALVVGGVAGPLLIATGIDEDERLTITGIGLTIGSVVGLIVAIVGGVRTMRSPRKVVAAYNQSLD